MMMLQNIENVSDTVDIAITARLKIRLVEVTFVTYYECN